MVKKKRSRTKLWELQTWSFRERNNAVKNHLCRTNDFRGMINLIYHCLCKINSSVSVSSGTIFLFVQVYFRAILDSSFFSMPQDHSVAEI